MKGGIDKFIIDTEVEKHRVLDKELCGAPIEPVFEDFDSVGVGV